MTHDLVKQKFKNVAMPFTASPFLVNKNAGVGILFTAEHLTPKSSRYPHQAEQPRHQLSIREVHTVESGDDPGV